MYIKKGDTVKILSGKDRGKAGAVLHAFPATGRVSIEGMNLYKKRSRPKRQGQKGETVLVVRPLDVSKVMLVCRVCKRPARIGHRTDGNTRVRYCKKCNATT